MSASAPEKTDQKLIQQAQAGDLEAFANLIERYEKKLTAYILRISSFRAAEAEEILQEVFLKAWKNLQSFDPSQKFSSWIYRIAHNHTISSFRKHQSRGYDKQSSIDKALFVLKTDEPEFGEVFDKNIRAEAVHEALQELDVKHREILVLKYFEDKSYEEISDILKKPMGTVASMMSRAKAAFKKKLIDTNNPSFTSYGQAVPLTVNP